MLRRGMFIALALSLGACATTQPEAVKPVTPRPILSINSATIDLEAKLEEGQTAFNNRDYEASFNAFTQVLVQDGGHDVARLGLAEAALALGLKNEAYSAFLSVDSENLNEPQKQQLLAGLSLLAAEHKHDENQETHLLRALAYAREDIRIWNRLGQYYDRSGQWDKSTDVYVEALKVGKSQDSVINNLGSSLMYQGRYAEAREKFKQAYVMEPTTDLYDNNMRLVEALSGRYHAAIGGLEPKRAAMLLNDAGVVALQRGDHEIAKTLLKRAITISPTYHAKAHANLKGVIESN